MIYIPKICGTCKGASKALELVYEIYEREIKSENPKNIYIYKEILHNPKVMEELDSLGIKVTNNLDEVTNEDIVIIRAHGEGKNTYDYLESNNIEYYDATCKNVQMIHNNVLEKYNDGYEIVIIGNPLHPEVIGTNGWCQNKGIIINKEEDIHKIKGNTKIYITCQTTFNKDNTDKIVNLIKDKFKNIEIDVNVSLCNAVSNIINSSIEVAKKCKYMFVVGGSNSSNTKEIFTSVSKYTDSYIFSNINDFIQFVMEKDLDISFDIGITGSSSTPLKEVYNYKYILSFLLFYKNALKELTSSQDKINQNLIKDDDNDIIKKVLNDFIDLNKDGKYIRGTLIKMGYFFATNEIDLNYLNLAYAYEMFQTSILIHDDIIDNAKLRRGKETIPRRICERYLNKQNKEEYHKDTLKLANSIAICAGDLGFYEANKLIIQNYENNSNLASLLEYYNDIIIKTIKGEIIDVILPFKNKYNYGSSLEKDVLDIYHLKTSYYTIIGPFFLGYILGGKSIDDNILEILNKIGISFQIKDDILGIFGNTSKLGKPNISDIEEFKQTILYTYIINTSYKDDFLKIYGKKNINNFELKEIRNLLIKSGSLEYANNYLNNIYNECLEKIDKLDILETNKDMLKGLLMYINTREK